MKLTHVRLLVNDFDACFRFYRDVMGFQVQWGDEGGPATRTSAAGARRWSRCSAGRRWRKSLASRNPLHRK